jgi:hypothetical protein
MGGGLMQLVAYGAQDIYLTGNPQITFFKVVYRRHTNFAMEAVDQTLNGSVAFGNKVTATVSRNGDLVGRMYLEVNISGLTINDDIGPNLGSALVNEVVCEIGGQQIDKHYGHWLEVYSELTEPNDSGHVGVMINDGTLISGTKFQNMSRMGGVEGVTSNGTALDPFWVPLQFWFNRNPGLALPLIALQYHEVKVSVTFNPEAYMITTNSTVQTGAGSTLDVKLWADYIYLDTDERRRFAQVSHEYLIEQVQFQTFSGTPASMDLTFNHPVKELIWTGVEAVTALGNGDNVDMDAKGRSTPTTVAGTNATYTLKLNGHERMAARDHKYFTRTQVWQHHTGFGGMVPDNNASNCNDSIAVYSFALKPEEHQPSGTCNFSRIDNAQLVVGGTGVAAYNVYAVNYNVLRVMSGMGGLAYSN